MEIFTKPFLNTFLPISVIIIKYGGNIQAGEEKGYQGQARGKFKAKKTPFNKKTRTKVTKHTLSNRKKRRTKRVRIVSKNKHDRKRRPSRSLRKGRAV